MDVGLDTDRALTLLDGVYSTVPFQHRQRYIILGISVPLISYKRIFSSSDHHRCPLVDVIKITLEFYKNDANVLLWIIILKSSTQNTQKNIYHDLNMIECYLNLVNLLTSDVRIV